MPRDIPIALEVPMEALTRAMGPEGAAPRPCEADSRLQEG
jgi:hypothetical protein